MGVDMQPLDPAIQNMIGRLSERYRRRLHLPSDETADLSQSLWAHLLEQASRYRPECGEYQRFAAMIVRRKAISLMRRRFAQRRDPRRLRSLNQPQVDGRPTELGASLLSNAHARRLGGRAISDEEHHDLTLDLFAAAESLTDRQRLICALLARFNVRETAEQLQLSRATVHRELVSVEARFRARGLDRYVSTGATRLEAAA